MSKILFLFFLSLTIGTKLYGQSESRIVFRDTIKVSGAMIYDQKKNSAKIIKNVTPSNFKTLRNYRRAYKRAPDVFLETIEVKSIFRRRTGTKIEFCDNDNSEKFQFSEKELLYNRYKIIFFTDVEFINLLNEHKHYVTFKCW